MYVGTLNKRRIIECVKGFHAYMQKHPNAQARFVIIGSSTGQELIEINDYIKTNGLENSIHTLGYIPQTRLAFYFNHAHCGISYMPLTMPFPLQPNTKTYEYLVNGIPIVATDTTDNRQLIENSKVPCGVIIEDKPQDIEQAIGKMLDSRHLYVKQDIAKEFNRFEWDNLFRDLP